MKNPIDGRQFKKELSLEEKRVIESFKGLPFIQEWERVDLILTWRKFKSANALFLRVENGARPDLRKIRKIIEDAGILFNEGSLVESSGNPAFWVCFVANNQADIELISRLWFEGRSPDNLKAHSELGRMYGYPPTAIQAFNQWEAAGAKYEEKGKFLLTDYEREHYVSEELSRFAHFQLSKENWHQELDTVRKWAEEIRLVDAELYKKIEDGNPMNY